MDAVSLQGVWTTTVFAVVPAQIPIPVRGGSGGGGGGGMPWGEIFTVKGDDGTVTVFPRRRKTGDPLLDAPREALENEVLSLRRRVAASEKAAVKTPGTANPDPILTAEILSQKIYIKMLEGAILSGMGEVPRDVALVSTDPLLIALAVAFGIYALVPDDMPWLKVAGYAAAGVIALKKLS
jgi:hypothetical protein